MPFDTQQAWPRGTKSYGEDDLSLVLKPYAYGSWKQILEGIEDGTLLVLCDALEERGYPGVDALRKSLEDTHAKYTVPLLNISQDDIRAVIDKLIDADFWLDPVEKMGMSELEDFNERYGEDTKADFTSHDPMDTEDTMAMKSDFEPGDLAIHAGQGMARSVRIHDIEDDHAVVSWLYDEDNDKRYKVPLASLTKGDLDGMEEKADLGSAEWTVYFPYTNGVGEEAIVVLADDEQEALDNATDEVAGRLDLGEPWAVQTGQGPGGMPGSTQDDLGDQSSWDQNWIATYGDESGQYIITVDGNPVWSREFTPLESEDVRLDAFWTFKEISNASPGQDVQIFQADEAGNRVEPKSGRAASAKGQYSHNLGPIISDVMGRISDGIVRSYAPSLETERLRDNPLDETEVMALADLLEEEGFPGAESVRREAGKMHSSTARINVWYLLREARYWADSRFNEGGAPGYETKADDPEAGPAVGPGWQEVDDLTDAGVLPSYETQMEADSDHYRVWADMVEDMGYKHAPDFLRRVADVMDGPGQAFRPDSQAKKSDDPREVTEDDLLFGWNDQEPETLGDVKLREFLHRWRSVRDQDENQPVVRDATTIKQLLGMIKRAERNKAGTSEYKSDIPAIVAGNTNYDAASVAADPFQEYVLADALEEIGDPLGVQFREALDHFLGMFKKKDGPAWQWLSIEESNAWRPVAEAWAAIANKYQSHEAKSELDPDDMVPGDHLVEGAAAGAMQEKGPSRDLVNSNKIFSDWQAMIDAAYDGTLLILADALEEEGYQRGDELRAAVEAVASRGKEEDLGGYSSQLTEALTEVYYWLAQQGKSGGAVNTKRDIRRPTGGHFSDPHRFGEQHLDAPQAHEFMPEDYGEVEDNLAYVDRGWPVGTEAFEDLPDDDEIELTEADLISPADEIAEELLRAEEAAEVIKAHMRGIRYKESPEYKSKQADLHWWITEIHRLKALLEESEGFEKSAEATDRKANTYGDYFQRLGSRKRRKLGHNTYLEDRGNHLAVRYHDTDVVRYYPDDTVTYHTGGWRTYTTKDRLNRFGPIGVYQKNGEWFFADGRPFEEEVDVFPELPEAEEVDWRPNEVIAEDYYARSGGATSKKGEFGGQEESIRAAIETATQESARAMGAAWDQAKDNASWDRNREEARKRMAQDWLIICDAIEEVGGDPEKIDSIRYRITNHPYQWQWLSGQLSNVLSAAQSQEGKSQDVWRNPHRFDMKRDDPDRFHGGMDNGHHLRFDRNEKYLPDGTVEAILERDEVPPLFEVGTRVHITGNDIYEGERGTIVEYDMMEGMYRVKLDAGDLFGKNGVWMSEEELGLIVDE